MCIYVILEVIEYRPNQLPIVVYPYRESRYLTTLRAETFFRVFYAFGNCVLFDVFSFFANTFRIFQFFETVVDAD